MTAGILIDAACFWAESGLSAFGTTNAKSGLSGHEPIADVGSKALCVTASRPISVIQEFQTAPKSRRQSPCRVMTEMSGKLAKGFQGTERQTRLLAFYRERSF